MGVFTKFEYISFQHLFFRRPRSFGADLQREICEAVTNSHERIIFFFVPFIQHAQIIFNHRFPVCHPYVLRPAQLLRGDRSGFGEY